LARKGAVILAFLNLCAWVPLTLAFILSRLGITPAWLALLWFINLMPGLMLSFQRDNWLSNLVHRGSLGQYLGQRLAIKSAFYLGAFCFLGYLLDSLGKDNLAGFAVIFTLAIAMAFIDFIIFTFMSGKNSAPAVTFKSETVKFGLPEYFSELKEKKLDSFVIFTTFFYLTVGLSGPLYAVYMLKELHFSYLNYTVIIAAEFLARVVSVPFWGRFADKAGNIRVLGIVSRIIPLVPVFWLFSPHLGYLVFVQILSGTCWGAFDLCTQSYLYKVAPPPKKLRYIIYTRCLVLLCTAMGGLLGAFCVNGIFPTFGSRILSIFWLSGISRALIVLYMMPRLVDLAVSFGKPLSPPEVDLDTLHRVLASKRGQFYRRQYQVERSITRPQDTGRAAVTDITRYTGRRSWAVPDNPRPHFKKPASAMPAGYPAQRLRQYRQATAARAENKQAVIHHELRQNEARLKLRYALNLQRENVSAGVGTGLVMPHLEPIIAIAKVKPGTGLYHDSTGWKRYMKDTLDAILHELPDRRVPVTVGTRMVTGVPGGIRTRDTLFRR
jgi:hypothetical protein